MGRLVEASICLVRDVNACVALVVHDSTHKGNGPFGGIETHDGHGRPCLAVQLVACLRKAQSILVVLVPSPAKLHTIALDPHRRSISSASHRILKHLAQGERHFGSWTTLAHFDWKLIVDLARPVETLAVLWADEALVAPGRHHDNSVVGHIVRLKDLIIGEITFLSPN